MSLLDTGALNFWGLESDPFSGNPLMFDDYNDYLRRVKTSTISSMNDLSQQLSRDITSKRIILRGNRGTGKTTAMRYIFKDLAGNNSCKTIYCDILNLCDTSIEDAKLSIHSAILQEIMDDFNNDERLRKDYDFQAVERAISSRSVDLIDRHIMNFIKFVHNQYDKLFLFIDNIDKPSPERYPIFQDYFSTAQGFYEKIISIGPTYLFLPMQPYMISKLEMSKQTEYLADKVVEVRNWSFDELDELLEKRIKLAYKWKEGFNISKFFNRDARLILYTINDFNPRFVIKGSRKILQKAYDMNKEGNKLLCKPVKKDFANRFKESMKGAIGFPEFRKFETINDIVLREHFEAYNNIENCLKQHEGLAYEVIEGLLAVWERRKYYEDRIKAILSDQNSILLKEDGKSREDDKYDIEPKIKNLIDFLFDAFYNDIDSVRYYLITSRM